MFVAADGGHHHHVGVVNAQAIRASRFRFKTNEAGVIVSIADPKGMFALVDNPAVRPIAEEADQRLRRVIAALQ